MEGLGYQSPSLAQPFKRMASELVPDAEPASLLDVSNLSITFANRGREVQVTNNVSFSIAAGERVGLVGESGCGKSVTGLALLGLLPPGTSRVYGDINFCGRNLVHLRQSELMHIRGKELAMVFQEPMSALDPVFTVGDQLTEALRSHEPVSRREARDRAIAALDEVGIPSPQLRVDDYPHQFSGGMRQRVMIAMALICRPKLIVADEPTTALDVTVQAQIIDLLCELSETTRTALLLITHDLGVVAETCSRVLTMYAGEIVEDSPTDAALYRPAHPYTSGLLRSLPRLVMRGSTFPSIPGRVPPPHQMPGGCRFRPRCAYGTEGCNQPQGGQTFESRRYVRCHRAGELTLPGAIESSALRSTPAYE